MSLIPTWPIAAAALAAGLIAGATADHVYMASKVSALELKIAKIEKAYADEKAQRSEIALSDYQAEAKVIHDAALAYSSTQNSLSAKMDLIRKDLKNVQAKTPLPVGCAPDPIRVRSLKTAIDAANQAIGPARQ